MSGDLRVTTGDAEATRRLGERIGGLLAAGDLVVLIGDLGAGKTTLTQGIARGLGVRDAVTSPTFVVARRHSNADGPDLVHVDAYRLGSLLELEDLDLEDDLRDCVVVVEWGGGLVDGLGLRTLTVHLSADDVDDTRALRITSVPAAWADELDARAAP